MKVWIVYDWMIDWDWNVQKVFNTKEKAKKWMKEHQNDPGMAILYYEESEVE